MRRLNRFFLAGVVGAFLVSGVTLFVAHSFQVKRNASALLAHARQAEQRSDGPQTSEVLRRYLNLRPADPDAWRWYARVCDQIAVDRNRRDELYLIYQEALQHNPDDRSLKRRCVDLALELHPQRIADARRYLVALESAPAASLQKEPRADDAARELAELKELEGKCLLLESDYPAAATALGAAITYDSARLGCYLQLARLERTELHQNSQADARIEQMITRNPRSGLARLYRFRYASEFGLPASDSDLKDALALAPEDPEVLLTAAQVAEQRNDPKNARSILERALKLYPQNVDAALACARFELRAQHLERAESVLRQVLNHNSPAEVLFLLAETLILQNKIEESDGARALMERLDRRGYHESYVRFLDARLEVQKQQWNTAIPKIEAALTTLKSEPQVATQLSLMLAECYTHLGWDEQRLEALRNAGKGPAGSEPARLALARSLTQSNRFDEALAIIQPIAASRPELRLEVARLWIEKTLRQPLATRDWKQVEERLDEARKAQPEAAEALDLVRADLLAAQEKWDAARLVLTAAQGRNPHSMQCRLALARLSERAGKATQSLAILDQSEKDLGPRPEIRLVRLGFWARRGGDEARAAVARLAANRAQLPAAERAPFLDQLAMTEIRLGELPLARQYWRELSALQPPDIRLLMARFELALDANDRAECKEIVDNLRKIEGAEGTHWRFDQARELIHRAQQGDGTVLPTAQTITEEIATRRGDWWGVSLLKAQIAELENQPEQALVAYMEAVRRGNFQPALIRRLVGLILERNQPEEIERLARLLRNQDAAYAELTALAGAVDALRKGDAKRALERLRQVISDGSTDFSDQLLLGRFLAAAGQTAEAGSRFKRALELAPGIPATPLSYVQFLVSTRQLEKARTFVAAAYKAQPAGRPSLTLALCSMLTKDSNQAEDQIQAVLEADPANPAGLRAAITFHSNLGRTDRGDTLLETLLHHAPRASADDLAWARQTRAALLIRRARPGDLDQALDLLDQNLAATQPRAQDQRLKATILATRPARRPEAIKLFEALANGGELDESGRFLLGQLYLSQGREDEYRRLMLKLVSGGAVEPAHLAQYIAYLIRRNDLGHADRLLADLKRIDPRGIDWFKLQAAILDARKQRPELLALLEAHSREFPDHLGSVAGLLSHFGFAHEAEEAYKAVVARDPGQPEAMLDLAEFLGQQNRVSEALDLLKNAWPRCRPDRVALAALAVYDAPSSRQEDREQVETWVLEAVRKVPANLALKVKLSAIKMRQGRFPEAEALCREVLENRPDDAEALNNLAWLLAMRDQKEAGQALSLIDRAIELNRSDPSLADTRAVILIRSGQHDRAIEQLQAVHQQDPHDPGVAFHMAWAYRAMGDLKSARAKLQEAERLGLGPRTLEPRELVVLQELRKTLGVQPAVRKGASPEI